MQGKQTLERHSALMNQMARVVGADLDEAELRGELAPELRYDMVLACTGCAEPERCQSWLPQAEPSAAPPSYCRNRDTLLNVAAE